MTAQHTDFYGTPGEETEGTVYTAAKEIEGQAGRPCRSSVTSATATRWPQQ